MQLQINPNTNIYKIRLKNTNPVSLNNNHQKNFTGLYVYGTDVFERSSYPVISDEAREKIETFQVKTHLFDDFSALSAFKKQSEKEKHSDRMAMYYTAGQIPNPARVDKKYMDAVYDVQYEQSGYSEMQEKLKKGEPLSAKEQELYDSITEQMRPSQRDRILWRSVTPYEGFEEEIQSGEYNFRNITSTLNRYNDFFDFWQSSEFGKEGDKFLFAERYIMKIKAKKGTKMLDCNVFSKSLFGKAHYPRIIDEVSLPPCKAEVTNIDNDLNVIEMEIAS